MLYKYDVHTYVHRQAHVTSCIHYIYIYIYTHIYIHIHIYIYVIATTIPSTLAGSASTQRPTPNPTTPLSAELNGTGSCLQSECLGWLRDSSGMASSILSLMCETRARNVTRSLQSLLERNGLQHVASGALNALYFKIHAGQSRVGTVVAEA